MCLWGWIYFRWKFGFFFCFNIDIDCLKIEVFNRINYFYIYRCILIYIKFISYDNIDRVIFSWCKSKVFWGWECWWFNDCIWGL